MFTYLFKCLISFFQVAFYEFESKLYLVVAVITADGNPLTNTSSICATKRILQILQKQRTRWE